MRIVMVAPAAGIADLVRAGLDAHDGFEVVGHSTGPDDTMQAVHELAPDLVALGDRTEWYETGKRLAANAPDVVKVLLIDDDELAVAKARDALELGFRGVLFKISEMRFVDSLTSIEAGHVLIEPKLARELHARESTGDGMSPRELEVLQLLVDGLSTKAIAGRLFIAQNTARNHIQGVLRKLGAHSRGEAVARAVSEGFAPRPSTAVRVPS